jgi:hypothetical protein
MPVSHSIVVLSHAYIIMFHTRSASYRPGPKSPRRRAYDTTSLRSSTSPRQKRGHLKKSAAKSARFQKNE